MSRIVIIGTLLLLISGSHPVSAGSNTQFPARVLYVTELSVYLDAGIEAGIETGDRFEVFRGDQAIARLEIAHLSSRKAACNLVEFTDRPVIGDQAKPLNKEITWDEPLEPTPQIIEESSPVAAITLESSQKTQFKGRIGGRYWTVNDRTERDQDYSQPSMTLRMEIKNFAGGPLGFYTDVRAKRTYRHETDGSSPSTSRSRVYRLEGSYNSAQSPWRVSAGRQVSPDFAAVSLFDGLLVTRRSEEFSFGTFAGTQPDPEDQGVSTDIFELGGFVKYERNSETRSRQTLTGGLVGSYNKGELNREYLFLRARFSHRKFNGYLSEEIDFNRDWKADAGEPGLTFTSTYSYLRYQWTKTFSLTGGFDNRRRVRLYRDRVTPETDFNDEFRQGTWIGLTKKIGRQTRLSLRGRSRTGGIRSITFYGWTSFPNAYRLRLRVRSSGYENKYSDGSFHSLSLGSPISRIARWELTRGLRREKSSLGGSETKTLHWTALDLDLTLVKRWYLTLSGEITQGDGEDHHTFTTSTSYRF